MAPKRSWTEADLAPARPSRQTSKRPRTRPIRAASDTSTASVSGEASALESSPAASVDTAATSPRSGSRGSSSAEEEEEEEEDDDDDDDDERSSNAERSDDRARDGETATGAASIVAVGGAAPKPDMDAARVRSHAHALHARLDRLLPMLRQANRELEAAPRSMEHVAEGEPHIEMNLALGVLEPKAEPPSAKADIVTRAPVEAGGGGSSSSSSGSEDAAGDSDGERHVLSRLLNGPRSHGKAAAIQEVDPTSE